MPELTGAMLCQASAARRQACPRRAWAWHPAIFCAALIAIIGRAGGDTIDVAGFGAKPNDGRSDTRAIRAAIDACRRAKDARLVFAPGTYDLWADPPAGKAWSGPRRPYFSLDSIERLTIDGNGAELLGHELAGFFAFRECSNLLIRDLTLDMDPLPFAGGRVAAASGKQFDLRVSPGHQATAGRRCEGVMGYDPIRRRLAVRGIDSYQMGFKQQTELVEPGLMRAFVAGRLPKVGSDVVVRHQIYGYNGFTFSQCSNVTLRDVTIYTAAGMGVYASDSTDFDLRRYRTMIRPGSGRWMSTTADATHFNTCRGTIRLRDCTFEAMGDDATNLHLMYMEVAGRRGKRSIGLTTKARRGHWTPRHPPRPGDRLEIGGGDNPLSPYCTATVESVEVDRAAKQIVVTFAGDLPERIASGDVVANASACPKARIVNCTVRNNRARGMLIQTRDAILERNRFEHCSGAALHIACDANYWKEGPGVRDVVIRGNTFVGCNFGTARRGAAIDVFAEVGSRLAPAGVHSRITIEGNTFKNPDGAAIEVNSADGVVIRNNTISGPADVAVAVDYSRNVEITGNRLVNGPKGGLRIGRNCDRSQVKASDNAGF